MVSLVEVQRVIAIPKTTAGKAPLDQVQPVSGSNTPGRTVVLVYSLNFFSTLLNGSASATMPASGNMAPEWLVVNGQYSDQRFIDMMVPLHMMAVQMAQLALQKGQHTEIKQLATSIISSQQQEIQAPKNLKKRLYGTSDTPTMMNTVDLANTGMLMPDQLAQQHPFDKAFIDSTPCLGN